MLRLQYRAFMITESLQDFLTSPVATLLSDRVDYLAQTVANDVTRVAEDLKPWIARYRQIALGSAIVLATLGVLIALVVLWCYEVAEGSLVVLASWTETDRIECWTPVEPQETLSPAKAAIAAKATQRYLEDFPVTSVFLESLSRVYFTLEA